VRILTIRRLAAADRNEWFGLWRGYLDFYGADLDKGISEATWSRLLSDECPVHGLVAEDEVGVIGFLNYVLHENTWSDQHVCYLEDLFVASLARKQGAGRSLIEHLAGLARREGWHRLYWMTHADNVLARHLYDKIALVTDWVRYDINTRESVQR
jgi:GNAT superfamily N-acetyltransferase